MPGLIEGVEQGACCPDGGEISTSSVVRCHSGIPSKVLFRASGVEIAVSACGSAKMLRAITKKNDSNTFVPSLFHSHSRVCGRASPRRDLVVMKYCI